jgi:hypothetical protein
MPFNVMFAKPGPELKWSQYKRQHGCDEMRNKPKLFVPKGITNALLKKSEIYGTVKVIGT